MFVVDWDLKNGMPRLKVDFSYCVTYLATGIEVVSMRSIPEIRFHPLEYFEIKFFIIKKINLGEKKN
jgi:hypothetical protein